MTNPKWSLNNITFNELPGYYLFGGKPRTIAQSVIDLVTDYGTRFVYGLSSRNRYEYKFIIAESDLGSWEDLHATVNGPVTPFYFSITGAGSSDAVLVRKEAGFDPQEMKSPGGSVAEPLYEYTLQLEAEVA